MMINSSTLSTNSLAQVLTEKLELVFYFVAFVVPLLLHGQQFLVGPIVNALLFIVARKLSWEKLWPVLFLPSLAAIMHGLVLGPLTVFLIYLLPAIFVGNLSLVLVAKQLAKVNPVARISLASLMKASVIFFATWILVQINLIPAALLPLMSMGQLLTAIVGGGVVEVGIKLLKIDSET